jgi:hypothetical protein
MVMPRRKAKSFEARPRCRHRQFIPVEAARNRRRTAILETISHPKE